MTYEEWKYIAKAALESGDTEALCDLRQIIQYDKDGGISDLVSPFSNSDYWAALVHIAAEITCVEETALLCAAVQTQL